MGDKKKKKKPVKKGRAEAAGNLVADRKPKKARKAEKPAKPVKPPKAPKAPKAAKPAKAAELVKAAPVKLVEAAKEHPVVAEVVAAALVATAAALRNPDKARQLAEQAGEELTKLSKEAAESRGHLWQLALEISRRALGSIEQGGSAGEDRARSK